MSEKVELKEKDSDEVDLGYKAPKKVDLSELAQKDKDDESLERYKKQLLGQALEGTEKIDDTRKVVVLSFGLIFPDKDHEDIICELDTKEKIEKLKQSPITIKEGTNYQFECKFKIYHDIISALKFINAVYRGGIKLENKSHMMGSYGPSASKVNVWRSPVFNAPSGLLARGTYKASTKFEDDDKTKHLEFEYSLAIKSDWDKEKK